jgi:pyruvate kinase
MPEPLNRERTKIVATLGPATSGPETLRQLCDAGVDVYRLNFSHGTLDEHAVVLERLRQAIDESGNTAAVLGDLCGPKIRLDPIRDGAMFMAAGDSLTIRREETEGVDGRVSTNYDRLVDEVEVGHRVLIDDGLIRFEVAEKRADEAVCRCTASGTLRTRKGINLPDSTLSVESLTDDDRACVAWAADHHLDYLALSFVRRSEDLDELRELACSLGVSAHLIAKIEKPEALDDIDRIIDSADGLMIARGDLGVEMDLARVPVIQKDLILRCRNRSRPVIVATQMLQSMIDNPSPTRAEVSDVANAIFDGADAVMLSGETAVGSYPVEAVRTMGHIARVSEGYHLHGPGGGEIEPTATQGRDHYSAIAEGLGRIVADVRPKLVVVWSHSGAMARHVSKLHLAVPVVAVGDDPAALRRMALYFGVIPENLDCRTVDKMRAVVDQHERERGVLEPGDRVVLVGGTPALEADPSTTIAIHTITGEEG